MPQFYRPQSSWGGAWGRGSRCKAGERYPPRFARLLMQLHGSSQVSPLNAQKGARAEVCFAGVAQLVEHLFCKQVVAGSSPTASSAVGPQGAAANVTRATIRESSESCPSGQREQAVNLPDLSYAGSNPALSTQRSRLAAGTNEAGYCFTDLGRGRGRAMSAFAGVAQLVERQPSKLNVEGSSPFSRSQFFGFDLESRSGIHRSSRICNPLATRWTRGSTRVGSLVAGEAEPRTSAQRSEAPLCERALVREHRTGGEAKPAGKIGDRQLSRDNVSAAERPPSSDGRARPW